MNRYDISDSLVEATKRVLEDDSDEKKGKKKSGKKEPVEIDPELKEQPRQLKNKKTETLVVKDGKVITIAKKDMKKFIAKGYMPAESIETDGDEITEEKKLTPSMISKLQKVYGGITKIDPSADTYKRLIRLLDGMNPTMLKQLVSADIKWITPLARNRLKEDYDISELGPFGSQRRGRGNTPADKGIRAAKKDDIERLKLKLKNIKGNTPADKGAKAAIKDDIARLQKEEVSEGSPGFNLPKRTSDPFEVKYAKTKKGKITVAKFETLDAAKKFFAARKKEGYNGIISKGGKPIKEEKEPFLRKRNKLRAKDKKLKNQMDEAKFTKLAAGPQPAGAQMSSGGTNRTLNLRDRAEDKIFKKLEKNRKAFQTSISGKAKRPRADKFSARAEKMGITTNSVVKSILAMMNSGKLTRGKAKGELKALGFKDAGIKKLMGESVALGEKVEGTEIDILEFTVSDVERAMKKKYGKIDREAIEKLKKVQYKGNVDRNDLVKVGHGKLYVEQVEGIRKEEEEIEPVSSFVQMAVAALNEKKVVKGVTYHKPSQGKVGKGEKVKGVREEDAIDERLKVTNDDPLVMVWTQAKDIDYKDQGISGHMNLSVAQKIERFKMDGVADAVLKAGVDKRVKVGKVWLSLSKWHAKEVVEEVVETNKNDKSDDGEGLDAVQPKAVKKKFKNRKDKDIDNDGDVDDSDKFLHKRRKAISKAISKEDVELDEEMSPEDIKAAAGPAMEQYNNEMRKNFPEKQFTSYAVTAPLGGGITFVFAVIPTAKAKGVDLLNAPSHSKYMMHLTDGRGETVPSSKFSIAQLMGRLPVKFRKITAKTPSDAVKKMTDWFKKNKSEFEGQIKEEVEIEEAFSMRSGDKRVVDAFYDKETIKQGASILTTDGKTLTKVGMGGQDIAKWVNGKIKIVAVSDVKSTEQILRYMKKSIPSGVFEEVELDEKKLTSNEKKKKEEIVKSTKGKDFDKDGDTDDRDTAIAHAIATKKAKKVAEEEVEEAFPSSGTTHALVIDKKVVAVGISKEMHKIRKKKGEGRVWVSKNAQIGDVKEEEVVEARRNAASKRAARDAFRAGVGDIEKDSADDDTDFKGGDSEDNQGGNIIIQLRKVISLRGLKPVQFDDGKKVKIDVADARDALNMHTKARTSIDKGKMAAKFAKSHKSFMKMVEEADPTEKKLTMAESVRQVREFAMAPIVPDSDEPGPLPTMPSPTALQSMHRSYGPEWTTSADKDHNHNFYFGEGQTMESNGHHHQLKYDGEGKVFVLGGDMDGHTHTAKKMKVNAESVQVARAEKVKEIAEAPKYKSLETTIRNMQTGRTSKNLT